MTKPRKTAAPSGDGFTFVAIFWCADGIVTLIEDRQNVLLGPGVRMIENEHRDHKPISTISL